MPRTATCSGSRWTTTSPAATRASSIRTRSSPPSAELASEAHTAGNRAFVYIAGTECITKDADGSPHTLAKDHPDWLQRKLTGEPAVFGGGAAFWIGKGDEDVWISPYAKAWREQYMSGCARSRRRVSTASTWTFPYWMTHFDGWEDSWASFDDYTVEAFRRKTGLDARRDLELGNFADPRFRQWVDFRIETITEFMAEIDRNAKSVNPKIMTIPEIYPGIEREAVVVGADVYRAVPGHGCHRPRVRVRRRRPHGDLAHAPRLVPLSGGHALLPRLRPGKGHLDSQLLLGRG